MVTKLKVDLKRAYFEYLVDLVCDKEHEMVDYIPLLDALFNIKFTYTIDRDANREADGANLRQKFIRSEDIDDIYLEDLEDFDVNILEVLISLAIRMEFEVGNTMVGDKMSEKFWLLLRNLDLEKYSSDYYEPLHIQDKVQKWLKRDFSRDGKGSPFPLKHCENDQRKIEIWDQFNNYIYENF